MDLSQFDYHLPESLIAQMPAAVRTQSRLLQVGDQLEDLKFEQLPELLNPGDLLIMNNTKVIPARLFGVKPTGGKIEIMLERITGESTALAQIRSNKSIKEGQEIVIADDINVFVKERLSQFFEVEFIGKLVLEVLEQHGKLPLPPYIKRNPDDVDDSRYQTVYAKQTGAVAAPTAGLHFDKKILTEIQNKGIGITELTLHVGTGTFQPVRVDDITQHKMHNEWFEINSTVIKQIQLTRREGGRVIAVGTTTVRALESAHRLNELQEPVASETDIFIYPGFEFKAVDALVTNFHLPKSTLLMMISAFAGYDRVMQAYQHAVENKYRFFSYGDAMFLERSS